jgi:protocatechuate 3,4-dioxygenase beta subunit
MDDRGRGLSRRRLIRLGLAVPVLLPAAACSTGPDGEAELPPAPAGPLPTTPACADADDLTPDQTEGPYFTPGSPQTAHLRTAGLTGAALTLTGFVVDRRCRPVARALLDFWQADAAGEYDNDGFTLRGHQFTTDDGGFRLETVVPGNYGGRTRHIHVKAQAPGGPVLTTQLYFPGERANRSDGIFNEALVMDLAADGANRRGRFTFVLATS